MDIIRTSDIKIKIKFVVHIGRSLNIRTYMWVFDSIIFDKKKKESKKSGNKNLATDNVLYSDRSASQFELGIVKISIRINQLMKKHA